MGKRANAFLVIAVASTTFTVHVRVVDADGRLLTATNALAHRLVEGRLSSRFDYRQFRHMSGDEARPFTAASDVHERWLHEPTAANAHAAGVALLLAGSTNKATSVLATLLADSGGGDIVESVRRSRDAAVLIDYSAAALEQRENESSLLRAFEAADRAWQLTRRPEAAWNRALAIERLGLLRRASRAWQEVANLDPESPWGREARDRRLSTTQRAAAAPLPSDEAFFQRELIERAAAALDAEDVRVDEVMPKSPLAALLEIGRRQANASGDYLALDVAASLQFAHTAADRARMRAALVAYSRGRKAFENDDYAAAGASFAAAESELSALRSPLALLARDQRIRVECSQGKADCLTEIRSLRVELDGLRRYPWLAARAAYTEGQTLFRQGRIYEAAGAFQAALRELRRLHDAAGEVVMHALLANAFAVAGETDAALSQYLEVIRQRAPDVGDRRRRQLEDSVVFLLRHGYLSTAALLLDELASGPSTDAGRVSEATLRGVILARRGAPQRSAAEFRHAHQLLDLVRDPTARSDAETSLAVAEAGSRNYAAEGAFNEIDAAIADHQGIDNAIWLPQLLTERGAAHERRGEVAPAERDYLEAMSMIEKREPRIDQTLIGFGISADSESPFDRVVRFYLGQRRTVDALRVAERLAALRVSSMYARSSGLPDVFRPPVAAAGDPTAEIQAVLRPGQVLVDYLLLRDELVTWIVTQDGIKVLRRPIIAPSLIARVNGARDCYAREDCHNEGELAFASTELLRPWIDSVPHDAVLILVPPAELQGVPFAMFTTSSGERLLERNPLVTVPSLRAIIHASRVDEARAGVVVPYFAAAPHPAGDYDPLPRSVSEVVRSSRFYSNPVVDRSARREAFLAQAPRFAIVQFAGHALVNSQQPLLSALLFDGYSGMLYVHELAARSFAHTRLVVLAGCETGLAPRPTMSIANALLSQDVPSVVYTLWRVPDDAAEAFGVAVHRAITSGMSRAEAVRSADLQLLKEHPEDPNRWAAFAISGAWGPLIER